METLEKKPLELIAENAASLRAVQEKLTALNAEVDGMKKEQARLSDAIVAEVEKMQGPDSTEPLAALVIEGVGTVKLNTAPHPRILDVDRFLGWCKDNAIMAPALTVNAKTAESWWKEQQKLNLPIPPEEIAPVFWKTTARINKSL